MPSLYMLHGRIVTSSLGTRLRTTRSERSRFIKSKEVFAALLLVEQHSTGKNGQTALWPYHDILEIVSHLEGGAIIGDEVVIGPRIPRRAEITDSSRLLGEQRRETILLF